MRTLQFGDYSIDQGALTKGTMVLFDFSGNEVLRKKISKGIKHTIKGMLTGEPEWENLTDADYVQMKKILNFVGLPNPVMGKSPKGKTNQQALKRKFEILVGEYNAGNDNLGPQIVKVVREMEANGLINKRLAKEAEKMYRDRELYGRGISEQDKKEIVSRAYALGNHPVDTPHYLAWQGIPYHGQTWNEVIKNKADYDKYHSWEVKNLGYDPDNPHPSAAVRAKMKDEAYSNTINPLVASTLIQGAKPIMPVVKAIGQAVDKVAGAAGRHLSGHV